jgi:creatinine amidohydrolase
MDKFTPSERVFSYLTWQEIAEMPNKENVVIIQPMGAIEQHGYHLPIIVDSAISVAVLGMALQQLPSEIPAYSLPNIYYGKSNEHDHFPGTITLSSETLTSLLMDVGESIYRAGFRKFVFMNGHGGQPQILQMVARDLHIKYDDFWVFPLFVWRVPNIAKNLLTDKEKEFGIHAGDAETSVLLSILPEQVKMDKAVKEYPDNLPENSLISMERNLPVSWATRDVSISGVIGDPLTATKEKGDRILQSLAEGWVKTIIDIYNFQIPKK